MGVAPTNKRVTLSGTVTFQIRDQRRDVAVPKVFPEFTVRETARLTEELIRKGRNVGIQVVLATQKATGDAIAQFLHELLAHVPSDVGLDEQHLEVFVELVVQFMPVEQLRADVLQLAVALARGRVGVLPDVRDVDEE